MRISHRKKLIEVALPLEAQRLGLEAHASDLNPVAVLINKVKTDYLAAETRGGEDTSPLGIEGILPSWKAGSLPSRGIRAGSPPANSPAIDKVKTDYLAAETRGGEDTSPLGIEGILPSWKAGSLPSRGIRAGSPPANSPLRQPA